VSSPDPAAPRHERGAGGDPVWAVEEPAPASPRQWPREDEPRARSEQEPEQPGGGEAARPGGEDADGAPVDDEMDAFFPSVARAAATGEDIGALLDQDLLLSALAERDEYLDALRRLQADFENFRKRTERQLAEVRARASESLLERLLPVLDAFDLAFAHLAAPGAGGETDAGAGESAPAGSAAAVPPRGAAQPGNGGQAGVEEALAALQQVGGLLRDTLAKEGLERIDAVGVAFDPTVHDAVAHAVGEGGTDDKGAVVDEVLRAGYLLKGRVLRPAMVKVRG